MTQKRFWFLSDIHLKTIKERNGEILLRFFRFINENPSKHEVVFLGDIFDFWVSDGRAFEKRFFPLIKEIKFFINQGGKLTYFEGNHDFHLEKYWKQKIKAHVVEDKSYINVNNMVVRCEHGDFINPDDLAYLNYRMKIRSNFVKFIADHVFPGWLSMWIGDTLSAKSRKKSSKYLIEQEEKLKTMIRSYALEAYEEHKFNLIVTGHMHIFDDYIFKTETGQISRSINLGTWLEKPRVLCLENDKIQILDLNQFDFK